MSAERHQRLTGLFHDLIELPLDQREAYLAKHCAGDHDTRDELDVFLSADADIANEFAEDPRIEIRLRRTIGITFRTLGMLDEAEAYLTRALELARETYPPDHPAFLEVLHSTVVLYDEQGRFDDSEPLHRELLERYAVVHGPDSRRTLGAQCNFGLFLYDLERYPEAEDQLRATLEHMQRVLAPDDIYLLNCAQGLGTSLVAQERFEEALPLFETICERTEERMNGNHPLTLDALFNVAHVRTSRGEHDASLELIEGVIRGAGETYPADHWKFGRYYEQRADVHLALGHPERAAEDLARALEILTTNLGVDHPWTQSVSAKIAGD